MSNEALEKYKALYAEYINYMVTMHNAYQEFSNKPTHKSFKKIKHVLYYSKQLHNQMQKAADAAFREEFSTPKPPRPINSTTRANILKQKEINMKIVEMLEQGPYKRGDYRKISQATGVEERRIKWIHTKLRIYKEVLFNEQQK